jgi:hypothetical protein
MDNYFEETSTLATGVECLSHDAELENKDRQLFAIQIL